MKENLSNFKFYNLLLLFFILLSPFSTFAQTWPPAGMQGDGLSENTAWQITTPAHLKALADYVNPGNGNATSGKYYKLMNNISLSDYAAGTGWEPIGFYSSYGTTYAFQGNFNGNQKIITGLVINNLSGNCKGLFGGTCGATIENLGVENASISFSVNNGYIGGIVGYMEDGDKISKCYFTGSFQLLDAGNVASQIVGGIAGVCRKSNITNCYSNCEIYSKVIAGGVAAYLISGTVSNCYAVGTVESSMVGGVVGVTQHYTTTCSIVNCVALNPLVKTFSAANPLPNGRIYGSVMAGALSLENNAAYENILNKDGNNTWNNKGANNKDGEDMSGNTILADGTLGGRFTTANGWTIVNGKLPGLFGNAVDMPAHIVAQSGVAPTITTTSLPNGIISVAYSQTLQATGDAPITWVVASGNLPNGLTLSTAGVISGTPTAAGTFNFTVKATNSDGSDTKALSIIIINPDTGYPVITTTSLPNGNVGVAYSQTLAATSETPVTWSIESGNLPTGLTLSTAGVISGTPTTAGTFNFTVKATNNKGSSTKSLSIVIGEVGIASTTLNNQIEVYPNPTTGQLTIDNGQLTIEMVEVYDVYGRKVGGEFPSNVLEGWQPQADGVVVDLTVFPKGVYFIKITTEAGIVTKKVIKQ